MLAHAADLEFAITHTEGEALLLESNLIKEFKPRYNIVLRDDKSYPYIYVATEHPFPRLAFHRGQRSGQGRYFGPYPSASAVRQTLNLLQKLFMIRQCEDSFFSNRSRPCLQYQIRRCTAPCVGLVEQAAYAEDVRHAELFLEGRSAEVIAVLVRRMEEASEQQAYERAARLRDQIRDLQRVRQSQYVSFGEGDFDIVAGALKEGVGCIQVFYIRNGCNLGNKTFFPGHTQDIEYADMLGAFLSQYYLAKRPDRKVPPDIIVDGDVPDAELLSQVLAERRGGPVAIRGHVRGERRKWLDMARANADASLQQRITASAEFQHRFEALSEFLDLAEPAERIECFDVSHTRGEKPVASCVVFDNEGPRRSDYRLFNITGVTPGDDYAAMHQALMRRYKRVKSEDGRLPDVLLIDGGQGQVKAAVKVLEDLQITDLQVVGIAKGPARRPGQETLLLYSGTAERRPLPDSAAFHLIQHVRDEAHRFASSGHRGQRRKQRRTSRLEQVAGIGSKRRQQLIKHFGGLRGITRAGIDELASVDGISRELATRIYESLHEDS
jgi:excinuclease ABC subunit C